MRNLTVQPTSYLAIPILLLGLATNFGIVSIILSLYLTYKIFNRLFSPEIFDSFVTRVVLTPFIYALILQCVVVFGWLLNRSFPVYDSLWMCALLLGLLYATSQMFGRDDSKRLFNISRIPKLVHSDKIALSIAGILTLMVTLLPLLVGGFEKASVMDLLNGNVDDSSHIAIINDRIQFNRGILYHADIAGQTRAPVPYPLGWHSANAMVIKAVDPKIKTGTQTIYAYVFTKVFWFFVMAFIFVKSIFVLFKVFGQKIKPSASSARWLTISSFIFGCLFLIDFFRDGFYSFFPQIASVILLGLVYLQTRQTEHAHDGFYASLPLVALLILSGTLTWMLVLPALLISVGYVLITRMQTVGLKGLFSEALHSKLKYWPLYILLAGALFAQYYTFSADPTSISFLKGILQTGGTPTYLPIMYVLVASGVIITFAFLKKELNTSFNNLLVLIIGFLALGLTIYFLQLIHIAQAAYYFYKMLSLVMALAMPIAIIGFALGLEKISSNHVAQTATITSLAVLLMLLPQIVDRTTLRNMAGYRDISKAYDRSIYTDIEQTSTMANYSNNKFTFYYVPYRYYPNEFANTMVKTNKPNSACYNTMRFVFDLKADFSVDYPKDLQTIKHDCEGKYTVDLITDSGSVEGLTKVINFGGLSDIIKLQTQDQLAE